MLNTHDGIDGEGNITSESLKIHQDKAALLNELLAKVPDLKIVISSAWRYVFHREGLFNADIENVLERKGVRASGRIVGMTRPDKGADECRSEQIIDFLVGVTYVGTAYVILDDLHMPKGRAKTPYLVQTCATEGLQPSHIDACIEILKEQSK